MYRLIITLTALLGWAGLKAQELKQLTDLPTLYIETQDREPVISKEYYLPATLTRVDANGVTTYNALGIRGRGNSTWTLKKKPYRLKFDKKQEFLGPERAKAKSWTLLANYADKSLLRNAVASCIGSFAGQPFTAAAEFVDVVLNGEYLGNYQISDQMEIRPKRVDITEQADEMQEGDDISGGYFLEVDGFAQSEDVYFRTRQGVLITIKSPDGDVICKTQIQYIQEHIQKFEDALFSPDFDDPDKGYRKYVDASTLASWYVSTELTGNPDGFWSTYIYKERGDDKIYWGPLWDYDIAFNNSRRQGDISHKLIADVGFGDYLTKLWVRQMYNDPWFVALIRDKWAEMVDAGVVDHVTDYIDRMAAALHKSQQLNYERWDINGRVYDEYLLFDTYAEYIGYLKDYIRTRADFLTETWSASEPPTPPTPSEPFDPDLTRYHTIRNQHTDMLLDVDNRLLCIRSADTLDETQQWQFVPVGHLWQIVNRQYGYAIADPTQRKGAGSYKPGAQLTVTIPNTKDNSQLWDVQPLTNNAYALVNKATGLMINNSGGRAEEGNRVATWNEADDNSAWLIDASDVISGINAPSADEADYQLTWSPSQRTIYFRGTTLPQGTVTLTDLGGRIMLNAPIAPEIPLRAIPAGVYLLAWSDGSRTRTVKITI